MSGTLNPTSFVIEPKIFWLLLLSLALFSTINVFASQELAVPQNLKWSDGSTATAMWDEVNEANYYKVMVNVYHESNLIGSTETGTAALSLDVQQEINAITENKGYSTVQVNFTVTAVKNESDGTSLTGAMSEKSPTIDYTCKVRLPAPTGITLSENGTLQWDKVEGANSYHTQIVIEQDLQGSYKQMFLTGTEGADGKLTANIADSLEEAYEFIVFSTSVGVAYGDEVKFSVIISAEPADTTKYVKSLESERSNYITYSRNGNLERLPAPTGITLSEDGTLQWDKVEGANSYHTQIVIEQDLQGSYKQMFLTGTEGADGKLTANIADSLEEAYEFIVFSTSVGVAYGDEVKFGVIMSAEPADTTKHVKSLESERSNYITYSSNGNLERLPAPTGITLSEDGTLQWDKVEGANSYHTQIVIEQDLQGSYKQMFLTGTEGADGKLTANIADSLEEAYEFIVFSTSVGVAYGDEVKFGVIMSAEPADTTKHVKSLESERSNYISYSIKIPVQSIKLSPEEAILYKGNSLYIGKTITPENAYYSKIDWVSSDESIAQVDGAGKITGIKEGNAIITATVNSIEGTVPVNVYTIESNIEDEETQQEAQNTAGEIIDDLGNNDNPDISNTDINQDDIGQIHDQIHEGIHRGDRFFIDWWYTSYGRNHYDSIWDEIIKYLSGGQFACGYDAGFEMYHTDNRGRHYRIGNITEFNKEIEFSFDMPDLPEVENGYKREFFLVRIHDGKTGLVPVDIGQDGKFHGKSNKFSDFVMLYKDTPEEQTLDISEDHVHALSLMASKPATTTEDGNIAYYICKTCGRWFEDATGLVEITDRSSVIIKAKGNKRNSHEKTGTIPKTGADNLEDSAGNEGESGTNISSRRGSGRDRSGKNRSTSEHSSWNQDALGWYYLENGERVKNAWRYLPYNNAFYWYYFDDNGRMKTGWLDWNGSRYYLSVTSDGWLGRMLTGWNMIGDKLYYFESDVNKNQGHLYMNTITPDGFMTGPDGARLQ